MEDDDERDVRGTAVRPQEQLLVDLVPELAADRVLCTSAGAPAFALGMLQRYPDVTICCHYLDLFPASATERQLHAWLPRAQVACRADLPDGPWDLAVLPTTARGEAEWTREWLQQAHERLALGGRLVAATDNPRDRWLGDELRKLCARVECRAGKRGVVYLAHKDRPLKRLRDFRCEFAFRDGARLLHACSRPGVFAHRRVDVGARRLMNAMIIDPGFRVLEIGCGSGVVSLAAAARGEDVRVHAVDSNARAVECVAWGAARNGLVGISVEWTASDSYADAGSFDLALANPPYFGQFRIAEHFVRAALAALRPGGRLLLVAKRPEWYLAHLANWYDGVLIEEVKDYYLVHGTRPDP